MKLFETNKEMLKHIHQYMLCNGYYYVQAFDYPTKKVDKWPQMDKKLNAKFDLELNHNQRQYRRNKGIASSIGLRCGNICILCHTKGKIPWDETSESFIDVREKAAKISLGEVLKVAIAVVDGVLTMKYDKRGYQLIKEDIQATVRFEAYAKHENMAKRIENLPVVTAKMRSQKEGLKSYYRNQCKIHGRKPVVFA